MAFVQAGLDFAALGAALLLLAAAAAAGIRLLRARRSQRARRLAGEAREAADRRLRAVFDQAYDAILLLDGDTVVECNRRAEEMFGRSRRSLQGYRLAADSVDPGALRAALASLDARAGGAVVFEERFARPDGTRLDAEITTSRLDLDGRRLALVIARDVGCRRRLEERARQAQKMEALGRLARRVAHDFNDQLTAILGHCEALEGELAGRRSARETLADLRRAAEEGAALTRELLVFGRSQELHPRILDVNAALRALEARLREIAGERVQLEMHLAGRPLEALIDPDRLEEVMVNLAQNARNAMPSGGTLTIETSATGPRTEAPSAEGGLSPPPLVRIRVSDTGYGMSDLVQRRALEPFYTEAPDGGGGLGLSTVYGIVCQSGGELSIASEEGAGTQVEIVLPRADAAAQAAPAPGGESVLLVEDSGPVRGVAITSLRSAGYRVFACATPGDALALVNALLEPIHLLVADVVLPGMTGIELARQLRRQRPGLRVLYISGYTAESILERDMLERDDALLHKPFTPATLIEHVRRILAAPPRGRGSAAATAPQRPRPPGSTER